MFMILSGLMHCIVALASIGPSEPTARPHTFTYSETQVHPGCVTCHHPHRPTGEIPYWEASREKPERFSLYQTRPGGPHESSLLCLSCHDGAVAKEVHLRQGQPSVSQLARSVSDINDMIRFSMKSHPIGVKYDVHNRKLMPLAGVEAESRIRLPRGRVECISCHDPHGRDGHKSLLVKANRRSELCLSCHRL